MDELDAGDASSSSSTPRLRRRSFYENMEPDPSAFAPPPLDAATQQQQNHSDTRDSGSHSSSSSTVASTKSDDHAASTQAPAASTSANGTASHGYRGGVAGALAQWLLASILTLLYRLQRWLRVRLRLHERAPFRFVRMLRERSAASAAVKHWAYPTQWLTLGCATLVLVQLVVFWHFQVAHFDLTVKECVFHEQLMPGAPLPGVAAVAGSSGGATRYLARRFEQLHHHAGRVPKHEPRLPWTCIAIVATDDDPLATAAARDLALLLPRHRVLTPTAAAAVASRLQLVVGAAPLMAHSAHAGVVGALFPLGAFRDERFPQGFSPDLVLVKTEHTLQRMLQLRQMRLDERHHRVGPRDADVETDTDADADAATHHEFASTHFGIYLTKATAPDIYERRVRKDWDAFLHVVVGATQETHEQFTKELLTTWLQHPEWPTLHVRFAHSLELCGSFVRFMSSVKSSRKRDAADTDDTDDNDNENDNDDSTAPSNVALSCDEAANSRAAIVKLKNQIGIHVFPTPPDSDAYEDAALESLAAGAIVVTHDTPVMREWVPDACGLRVGVGAAAVSPTASDSDPRLPAVRVTTSDVERAVETLLLLDRVHRVAWGRAARAQYLRLRTHYLSAMAALDAAVCDDDTDDALAAPSDVGLRSRSKVQLEALRVFLY
ncbi:hypothetical protein PybrP1_003670 [[Pythium] brassicae (nom. inval.)]|nr:hypothetical protein PybrP1_003670 [[Pythium] brassicae (nom. inval.)]